MTERQLVLVEPHRTEGTRPYWPTTVASDSTAFRVIDRIASTPGLLDALADAHARARGQVWKQVGAPDRVTIEVDATLIASHSEKEGAAGNFKGG